MGKRGQLSSFIIIGMLFVAAFAFLYFISYLHTGGSDLLFSIGLSSEVNSLKESVDACLEQKTREGIDYFGVDEDSQALIEQHIETNLNDCIEFESFEELGLDIESGSIDARVLITDRAVVVNMRYPITITKGDATTKLENFNYYMARERTGLLSFGPNLRTTQDTTIVTEDKDAELTIPAGTKVSDENGNPIDEVSLKILDRNFDGLSNNVVVGMAAYEGFPDGARFDPPVTIKLNYDPNEIPPGIKEEDLKIGWFDRNQGFWWGLPTTVDTVNKILSAEISHFTPFGATVCSPENAQDILKNAEIPELESSEDGSFRSSFIIIKVNNYEFYFYALNYLPLFEQTCGKSYKEGDCLSPTQWALGDKRGWHEIQKTPPDSPNLQSGLNPSLPTMVTYGQCVEDVKLRDWDEDDQDDAASRCGADVPGHSDLDEKCKDICIKAADEAYSGLEDFKSGDGISDEELCYCPTHSAEDLINYELDGDCRFTVATSATYGYEGDKLSPGGWAVIQFNVGSGDGSDACIMRDENEEPEVYLKLLCSYQDICGNTIGDPVSELLEKAPQTQFTENFQHSNIKFNPDPQSIPSQENHLANIIGEEKGIIDGPNNLYVKVMNMDIDGCVWAEAQLTILGIGITWELPKGSCTVQEAINAICKVTDPSTYPDCPNGFAGAHDNILNRLVVAAANKATRGDITDPAWRNIMVNDLPTELSAEVSAWCAGGSAAPGNDCLTFGGECKESCDENTETQKSWSCDEGVCCAAEECLIGELKKGMECLCKGEPIPDEPEGLYCCEDGLKEEECGEEPSKGEAKVDCPHGGYLGLSVQVKDGEVDWRINYKCLSDVNLKLSAPGYSATQNYGRNMNDPHCGGKQILPEYEGNLKRFPAPECEGMFGVSLYDAGGQCEHKTVTVSLPCK